MPGDNNGKPEVINCKFNLTNPTNSFELWSNDIKGGRIVIESVKITYKLA